MNFKNDPRFGGIAPFEYKVWLSSPTMHGDEQRWVDEAIQTNWVSTVGENINVLEKEIAAKIGRKYGVALSSGTAALHLAIRLAGERLYGPQPVNKGYWKDVRFFAAILHLMLQSIRWHMRVERLYLLMQSRIVGT